MTQTNTQYDIAVGLGRLEGKLDGFLAAQTAQGKRIEDLETHVDEIAHDVTTLKATKAQGSNWFATGLTMASLFIAALALYFSGGAHG